MKRFLLGSVALLLLVFIAIQFAPVAYSNPPVVSEPAWDSATTRSLTERACFDCHSNQTKWPWYTRVAPVSWYIVYDVQEGRQKLNFSTWRPGGENEAAEEVVEGEMPPRLYLLLHPEARLTAAEKQQLVTGLNASLGEEKRERKKD